MLIVDMSAAKLAGEVKQNILLLNVEDKRLTRVEPDQLGNVGLRCLASLSITDRLE
jgi:hypothetical protein